MGEAYIWVPNAISSNGQYITGWGINPSIMEWGDLITFRLELSEILGVSKQEKNLLTLYPNPVTDVLHINATKNIQSIAIYNLYGKMLLNKNIGTLTTAIAVSNFESGMYIVAATNSDNQTQNFKMIKK
jgi:hypothetical protein